MAMVTLGAVGCSTLHPATQNPPISQKNTMKTVQITSRYDFNDTVARLKQAITGKNMLIFAEINHQQAAQDVGLTMQPATVLVFGTPKAGTPLMVKDPSFALQLPLKVLITKVDGKVVVAFTDTKALIAGSQISFDEVQNTLASAEKLIAKTVSE